MRGTSDETNIYIYIHILFTWTIVPCSLMTPPSRVDESTSMIFCLCLRMAMLQFHLLLNHIGFSTRVSLKHIETLPTWKRENFMFPRGFVLKLDAPKFHRCSSFLHGNKLGIYSPFLHKPRYSLKLFVPPPLTHYTIIIFHKLLW